MKRPTDQIIHKVMEHARQDSMGCDNCRDFNVMLVPMERDRIYVRYIKVDASNPDHVGQVYRWLCFDSEGEFLHCDPKFESMEEESSFKVSMRSFHFQKYMKYE